MNSIQNISLTNSIIAYKTVYLWRKLKLIKLIIFKIGQGKFFKMHIARKTKVKSKKTKVTRILRTVTAWIGLLPRKLLAMTVKVR